MIDFGVIAENVPAFWKGLQVTLLLLVITCASGFVLSIPLAVARVSPNPWLAKPVFLFTYVLRGTPLLVQMFMVYHGLAQFEAVRESIFWVALKSPWFCAWLVFTLNTTAYTTEIFAGALRATPSGELEAARSLGLTDGAM
jgi:arginine/ornithine transport system permease protein